MADLYPHIRPPQDRVDLRCDSCGRFDRHPKVVHVISFTEPGGVSVKHWDCCRADGCPNGHCTAALDAAQNAHGDSLIAWAEAEMAAGRR